MPPQIQRLLLLVMAIAGAYFTAVHFLTPKSFGQYGWYRGAALGEIAALSIRYAGKAACADCHSEILDKMAKSKHQGVACEACHGASADHAENPAVEPRKITDPQFCLRCHRASPSKPAKFPQVDPADHFGDSRCQECHLPHSPNDSPTK